MALDVKLDAFEGPFDLLFHLIEKNQIDIYDIPIAELTEQYIAYLYEIEEKQLDLASEFLVMASTLLCIKSQMLLPQKKDNSVQLELAASEDDDPRGELVNKLIEYKKYKDIAAVLQLKEKNQSKVFKRPPQDLSYLCNNEEFSLTGVTFADLKSCYLSILKKKNRDKRIHPVSKDPFPLIKKVREVYNILLTYKKNVYFSQLLKKTRKTKLEIIVTFLAILELEKMNKILASQERPFEDIIVEIKGGS